MATPRKKTNPCTYMPPSETIWSNTSESASPHLSSNYRTVFDQVDPNVAKILGSSSSGLETRRFSFEEPQELESNLFYFKSGLSHVPYTASTGGPHAPVTFGSSKSNPIQLGTASINGGIANIHTPQDSFLHKFSSVADATRDIELSSTLGTLSLDANGRRGSNNHDSAMKQFNVSPHGSMNENLNMPQPRTSRHQSISEKIDNYNNNSPIQTSVAMSVNSDLSANVNNLAGPEALKANANQPQSFWNPATATVFTPSAPFNYFLDSPSFPQPGGPMPPNPYAKTPMMVPINPPPFMMGNFMEGGMYGMMNPGAAHAEAEANQAIPADTEEKFENSEANVESSALPPKNSGIPGIGLMSRPPHPNAAGFVFHPFNPYPGYPQPPHTASPGDQSLKDNEPGTAVPENKMPPAPSFEEGSNGAFTPSPPAPPRYSSQTPLQTQTLGKRGKPGRGGHNGGTGKGGHHIYRSPLLEEVRSNPKGKEYFLKDIHGHVVEFTKDQHGSRFIQQKLPVATAEEKEIVFNEIRDISFELMTDVFGNYVIQKFFEYGSATQKQVLLEYMSGNIYDLSLQMYGCRVVQRALEALPVEGQVSIVSELKDHVLTCAKDQNGNHVIQKSIEKIPFENVRFILDSLGSHIYHLSTHPYGCRVIQRLLEYSDVEDQKNILAELNRFVFYLIQDQYGNYVIQHILERGSQSDKAEILKVAFSSIVNFSKHKFASNVIEKCIKHGTLEQRQRIWREVMLGNEDLEKETVEDDSPLALMMKDQYANYVIQKLVECFDAKSKEKKDLVVKLRQYLKQLSMKNNYGKHLASVEKMIAVAETALVDADRS